MGWASGHHKGCHKEDTQLYCRREEGSGTVEAGLVRTMGAEEGGRGQRPRSAGSPQKRGKARTRFSLSDVREEPALSTPGLLPNKDRF